jgi:hypothetical protein
VEDREFTRGTVPTQVPARYSAGDDKVIVPARVLAHGSGSEISLTASVTWVWTFAADGLSAHVALYDSREDALEAAGGQE